MISLSNLAFPSGQEHALLPMLSEKGLRGIEVAPTRIAPWKDLSVSRIRQYKSMLGDIGLSVPALQSIFFGAHGIALLQDNHSFGLLVDHLRRVSEIAIELGAKTLVFGAPKQRARGDLSKEAACDLGLSRLWECAEVCKRAGNLVIGLEPVPSAYGGDFLCTSSDVTSMIHRVSHPSLRLHLDTGCALLAGDSISSAIHKGGCMIQHFHLSEPHLSNFNLPVSEHEHAAKALKRVNYSGWCSIEMREDTLWREACQVAVGFAVKMYSQV
jgi:D-psicose/D-tagatose/L-ribulose 3-epimerase